MRKGDGRSPNIPGREATNSPRAPARREWFPNAKRAERFHSAAGYKPLSTMD
jgi:hypothetical protein